MQQRVTSHQSFTSHHFMTPHQKRINFIKEHTTITDGGAYLDNIQDKNNCTIIATSIAFKMPYKEVYQIAKQLGRKDKDGFWIDKILQHIDPNQNLHKIHELIPQTTIYSTLKSLQTGRYIIKATRHCFSLIDGIIYDTGTNFPLKRIRQIYQILHTPYRVNTIKDIV